MKSFNLDKLVAEIQGLNSYLNKHAIQQVNISLTIRNWMVGMYIVEYEQNGSDRAIYGAGVLKSLEEKFRQSAIKGLDERTLRTCRSFYQVYPQIRGTVSAKFQALENDIVPIRGTLSPELQVFDNEVVTIRRTLSPEFISLIKKENIKSESDTVKSFDPEILITRLNFSHFIELLKESDPLKRAFYEVQTIKNNWSVRELGRAMSTLLFERTGLSKDKDTVISKIKDELPVSMSDSVKNPFFLEFLGLQEKPEYSESDLETAIINNLQDFLVELGRGFCFEARQKRITFDNKHYKIDLVFYNRILKCHVLIDLKVGEFDHADAGQMHMYLNYYKENETCEGDNPPVGIVLCASKNDALVHYATAGLPQEIFVGKYMIQLPSVQELKMIVENEL